MTAPERWLLSSVEGEHAIAITDRGLGKHVVWTVDGEQVAEGQSSDERVVLAHEGHGAVAVRLPRFVGPARRVTWWPAGEEAEVRAHTGLGGTDLDPEPGTKAAEREEWIRQHPRQYAIRRALAATAGVTVPLLLAALLALIPWGSIPWPDIPWPDLPRIPWPDLPQIPWPDWRLPDWSVPDWVREVLDKAKYVFPVLVAIALAQGEVRRRRTQDARKRADAVAPPRDDAHRPTEDEPPGDRRTDEPQSE